MSARLLLVPGLSVLMAGCASWVWNERYTDCSASNAFEVVTAAKPLTVRVGPYPEPDGEDEDCEVVTRGLFLGGQGRYDGGSFEMWDVGVAHFRHTGDALDVASFAAEWGYCDTEDRGICGEDEGLGGLVEIDSVQHRDGGIEGMRLHSLTSGRIELDDAGLGVYCTDCSLRAALSHADDVEVIVDRAGADGAIDLCIAGDVIDITLPSNFAAPARIEIVSMPSQVTLTLPDGEFRPDIELLLLPNAVGYDFRGFGAAVGSGDGPRIELDGSARVDLGSSDARCEVLELTWSD